MNELLIHCFNVYFVFFFHFISGGKTAHNKSPAFLNQLLVVSTYTSSLSLSSSKNTLRTPPTPSLSTQQFKSSNLQKKCRRCDDYTPLSHSPIRETEISWCLLNKLNPNFTRTLFFIFYFLFKCKFFFFFVFICFDFFSSSNFFRFS